MAVDERRLTIWQLSFLIELPLLALVLADPGSDFNHLVDLVVLTVLVVGELWVRLEPRPGGVSALGAAIALRCSSGVPTRTDRPLQSDTADAAKSLAGPISHRVPDRPA